MIISNRAAGNSLPSCHTGTTKTSVIPNRDKYSGQDYVPPAQQVVNSRVDNTYKPNLWPQANMERMIARRRMASRSLEGKAGGFISQEKLIRFGGVPCINVAAAYCFYDKYGGEGGIVSARRRLMTKVLCHPRVDNCYVGSFEWIGVAGGYSKSIGGGDGSYVSVGCSNCQASRTSLGHQLCIGLCTGKVER